MKADLFFPDYKSSYLAPSDYKSDGTGWNGADGTTDGTDCKSDGTTDRNEPTGQETERRRALCRPLRP